MSLTNDVMPDANTIYWPECINDPPKGWSWGRHVSMVGQTGYYLIRAEPEE